MQKSAAYITVVLADDSGSSAPDSGSPTPAPSRLPRLKFAMDAAPAAAGPSKLSQMETGVDLSLPVEVDHAFA